VFGCKNASQPTPSVAVAFKSRQDLKLVFSSNPKDNWILLSNDQLALYVSLFVLHFQYCVIFDTITRPHCSTTTMYIDAACYYRLNSVVCQSVCHSSEPCKNGLTDRDAIWVDWETGRC